MVVEAHIIRLLQANVPLRGNITLHTSVMGKCKVEDRINKPSWGGELSGMQLGDGLSGNTMSSGSEEGNGAAITVKGVELSGCNLFPGSKVQPPA